MTTIRRDYVFDTPWALQPAALTALASRAEEAVPMVAQIPGMQVQTRSGSVAVLPLHGIIENRSDWISELMGGTSIETLRAALADAMADPNVKAVVLDVDSPGGTVAGMTEFASELRALRGGAKPIVAVTNTLAASAAYWLASQADEIVVTPSGYVGSIGVYAVHQEASRMLDEMGITTTVISAGPYKTEGNEFEPLTDDARADIQERVDLNYRQFLEDVAAGRRTTASEVEANYGGGRVLPARKALAAGMVDRVETLAATITRLGSTGGRRRVMSADDPALEVQAVDPTFTERAAALAVEATELAERAAERARLRAKEHRPAFSTTTEAALRATRDAIDTLLALDEPAPPTGPDDPEPTVALPTPPVAVAPSLRRLSDEEWLAHLEAMKA
jgi:signal peptide peptidase SppA